MFLTTIETQQIKAFIPQIPTFTLLSEAQQRLYIALIQHNLMQQQFIAQQALQPQKKPLFKHTPQFSAYKPRNRRKPKISPRYQKTTKQEVENTMTKKQSPRDTHYNEMEKELQRTNAKRKNKRKKKTKTSNNANQQDRSQLQEQNETVTTTPNDVYIALSLSQLNGSLLQKLSERKTNEEHDTSSNNDISSLNSSLN